MYNYTSYVERYLRGEFPQWVSYSRFLQLLPSVLIPLCAYLKSCYGPCTRISFIDLTPITVCDNRRISQHKVFDRLAARGRNSVDWFFGFKLHLAI